MTSESMDYPAELARLYARLDEVTRQRDNASANAIRMSRENMDLCKLLARYEYIADDYGSSCLACGTDVDRGHAPNCPMKAAMERLSS